MPLRREPVQRSVIAAGCGGGRVLRQTKTILPGSEGPHRRRVARPAAERFRASDLQWRFPAGAGGISTAIFPHLPPTTYPPPSAVSRVWPRPGIRARGWDANVGAVRDLSRSDREPPLRVPRERSGGMTPEGSMPEKKWEIWHPVLQPLPTRQSSLLSSSGHFRLPICDCRTRPCLRFRPPTSTPDLGLRTPDSLPAQHLHSGLKCSPGRGTKRYGQDHPKVHRLRGNEG